MTLAFDEMASSQGTDAQHNSTSAYPTEFGGGPGNQKANTIQEWARAYIERGFAPIPIPFGSKAPTHPGWPTLRLTKDAVDSCFENGNANIGLLAGEPSGGLLDVDLDSPEANTLADVFLSPTQMVHGRPGNPRSHRWYRVTDVPRPKTVRYQDPSPASGRETMLVELRSTGCQTVVPPSKHPSGETIRWQKFGEPAIVPGEELQRGVALLAATALLTRHWPAEGARHEFVLALAGYLLRCGLPLDVTHKIVEHAARAAGDEEVHSRLRDVKDTARMLNRNGHATGRPTLQRILGPEVVARICEWLHLSDPPAEGFPSPRPLMPPPPDAMDEAAYYGLAKDIVRALEPHTEADPVALIAQLLTAFGNAAGRKPYWIVENDKHHLNLFTVLVGQSAKGRKGTSWGHIRSLLETAAPEWSSGCLVSGLSSGEGLIFEVRDRITKLQPVKRNGMATGELEEVLADEGVIDKRRLVMEGEFAKVLDVMGRDGSILSPVLREAWDTGDLKVMTKNSPCKATEAHISIVGHITRDELLRCLNRTEAANGFGNRFLWLIVRRSKCLPFGGNWKTVDTQKLSQRLREALDFAQQTEEINLSPEAADSWRAVYPSLSEGKPGLAGALTARGEAQVRRLACIYALLDLSSIVRPEHLEAALAFWEYVERSVRSIFGDALGNPVADQILKELQGHSEGLTRTQISDLFGRNKRSTDIGLALAELQLQGLAQSRQVGDTGGRPVELWTLSSAPTKETR